MRFCQPVPGKWSHDHAVGWSLWQSGARKPVSRIAGHSLCPAPVPGNSAARWHHLFFCPQRSLATTPKCALSRGTIPPCVTLGILRPCCLLWVSALLPTGAPLSQAQHQQWQTNKTSDFALFCL